MPFDCTPPRGPSPGPDPAPTWAKRAACWAALAAIGASCTALAAAAVVFVLAMAARYGTDGAVLGLIAAAPMLWATVAPLRASDLRALASGRWP